MSVWIETAGQLLELLRSNDSSFEPSDGVAKAIIELCAEKAGRDASSSELADFIQQYLDQIIDTSHTKLTDVPLTLLRSLLLVERDASPDEDGHLTFRPVGDHAEIRISDQAVAKYGLLLDQIYLGPLPGFSNKFPVSSFDAIVVDGEIPTPCPQSDRPIPKSFLPKVVEIFERQGYLTEGQTIHWVGSQSRPENICECDLQSVGWPPLSEDDKKDDKQKIRKTKLRRITNAAVDCARRFKQSARSGFSLPMKTVVSDYVEEIGRGSVDSIMRTLNDNPELWKDDKKTTKDDNPESKP